MNLVKKMSRVQDTHVNARCKYFSPFICEQELIDMLKKLEPVVVAVLMAQHTRLGAGAKLGQVPDITYVIARRIQEDVSKSLNDSIE